MHSLRKDLLPLLAALLSVALLIPAASAASDGDPAAASAASSGDTGMLPPPPGPAPLRYRDAVFPLTSYAGPECPFPSWENPFARPWWCSSDTYGSAIDKDGNPVSLTLQLFQPATLEEGAGGDTANERPAIVLVHGGYFCSGFAGAFPMPDLAQAYARLGYVAVSINYRLLGCCVATTALTPGCLSAVIAAQHDAQAAVRWLRASATQYRIDPNRIAIAGFSAGAVTSLNVGSRAEDPGDSGNPGYSSRVAAAVSYAGGLPFNAFFDQGDAPTMLVHGTEDAVVPFAWARSNACALEAAGVPVVFQPRQGLGHSGFLWSTGERAFTVAQTSYFLYDALDLANADQSGGSPPVQQQSSPTPNSLSSDGVCAEFAQSGSMNPLQAKPKRPPRCHGHRATIVLPAAANARRLIGTPKADVIVGTSRNDRIVAGRGDDLVCAGGGSDTVKGGRGSDALYGQGGRDTVMGQAGGDLLSGGARRDACIGGRGKDTDKAC